MGRRCPTRHYPRMLEVPVRSAGILLHRRRERPARGAARPPGRAPLGRSGPRGVVGPEGRVRPTRIRSRPRGGSSRRSSARPRRRSRRASSARSGCSSGKRVVAWALEGDLDAAAAAQQHVRDGVAAAVGAPDRGARGRPRRVVRRRPRRGAGSTPPRSRSSTASSSCSDRAASRGRSLTIIEPSTNECPETSLERTDGMTIRTTLYSDPACPWALFREPRAARDRVALPGPARLAARAGRPQRGHGPRYEAHGYTPVRGARGGLSFRGRYGMPFAPAPKPRLAPSSRACRAVIAARLQSPGSEWHVFRWLQFANFNTPAAVRRRRADA